MNLDGFVVSRRLLEEVVLDFPRERYREVVEEMLRMGWQFQYEAWSAEGARVRAWRPAADRPG